MDLSESVKSSHQQQGRNGLFVPGLSLAQTSAIRGPIGEKSVAIPATGIDAAGIPAAGLGPFDLLPRFFPFSHADAVEDDVTPFRHIAFFTLPNQTGVLVSSQY